MSTIQYTKSPGVPPQSMEAEFLSHKNGSEWWYCTGYLNDKFGKLYTFQFTLVKVKIFGISVHVLMTALSNFDNGQHHYSQRVFFFGRNVNITSDLVGVNGQAEMRFFERRLDLSISAKEYSLSLNMDIAKAPVWHCDDGVLRMGIDDPKQTTYYWSYTNLRATGELVLGNKHLTVSGKAWFDRQGGTFSIFNRQTHWEWFSIRFFDDEEVMLFSFPQSNYRDGTYIDKSGKYKRFTNYGITPLGFTEAGGYKFSFGWKVKLPGIKDEVFTITPKMDGQLNLAYYELLADAIDINGNIVGFCVVELLPGVYSENVKVRGILARQ